jgi:hypothetical protein
MFEPAVPGLFALPGNAAAALRLHLADAIPSMWIDGHPATVSVAGRAPGYQGLDRSTFKFSNVPE